MIGKFVKHKDGYSAFVPVPFPSKELLTIPENLIRKAADAERLIGKLDGITHNLPNIDFFIKMFEVKDATNSSQIEGTRATIIDALEMSAGINTEDTDADDILHYIQALHYGLERLKTFPLSLRLIREIHKELMLNARSSHFADPGEFRNSQNWIGGTTLKTATFIPPSVVDMKNALSDLEKFFYSNSLMPILQAGIIHAQFETIHPFLDGNGRTGRLMITLFLSENKILEKPVLFISSYFKKYQYIYYEKLNAYHNNKPIEWLDFFLDGVIETAQQCIEYSKNISMLRERDLLKIQSLGKREANSGVLFLNILFNNPIVTNSIVADTMNFSRAGAAKLIERFIELDILHQSNENDKYGKVFTYKNYLDVFNS